MIRRIFQGYITLGKNEDGTPRVLFLIPHNDLMVSKLAGEEIDFADYKPLVEEFEEQFTKYNKMKFYLHISDTEIDFSEDLEFVSTEGQVYINYGYEQDSYGNYDLEQVVRINKVNMIDELKREKDKYAIVIVEISDETELEYIGYESRKLARQIEENTKLLAELQERKFLLEKIK